jgi:hypothetical protein
MVHDYGLKERPFLCTKNFTAGAHRNSETLPRASRNGYSFLLLLQSQSNDCVLINLVNSKVVALWRGTRVWRSRRMVAIRLIPARPQHLQKKGSKVSQRGWEFPVNSSSSSHNHPNLCVNLSAQDL